MTGPILHRNPEVVWRDEPGQKEQILAALERGEQVAERGWVILVDGGQMVELNLLAGEIWCLLDGARDLGAVATTLAERFDAPADEIRADVEELVGDFTRRGWLIGETP
ncbi:MAG: pyrroloquinoline quinone biosynthesis peptide chaperone PqqD [Deferrisomatales bacterium]|nr:pyrroloquinoline quinone biosynthesis peptide chaperone PqqD [Deferrisomatales bacterium]